MHHNRFIASKKGFSSDTINRFIASKSWALEQHYGFIADKRHLRSKKQPNQSFFKGFTANLLF
jgi:hypothetical protein